MRINTRHYISYSLILMNITGSLTSKYYISHIFQDLMHKNLIDILCKNHLIHIQCNLSCVNCMVNICSNPWNILSDIDHMFDLLNIFHNLKYNHCINHLISKILMRKKSKLRLMYMTSNYLDCYYKAYMYLITKSNLLSISCTLSLKYIMRIQPFSDCIFCTHQPPNNILLCMLYNTHKQILPVLLMYRTDKCLESNLFLYRLD